jgi:hypothetical protein
LNGFSSYKTKPLLAMGNHIQHRISRTLTAATALKGCRDYDKTRLFDIFMEAGDASVDALIILNRMNLLNEYRRFCRIKSLGLVRSEEIMKISGIEPGRRLGEIILEVKKAQFAGRLKSKRQAVSMLHLIAAKEHAVKDQDEAC